SEHLLVVLLLAAGTNRPVVVRIEPALDGNRCGREHRRHDAAAAVDVVGEPVTEGRRRAGVERSVAVDEERLVGLHLRERWNSARKVEGVDDGEASGAEELRLDVVVPGRAVRRPEHGDATAAAAPEADVVAAPAGAGLIDDPDLPVRVAQAEVRVEGLPRGGERR